MDYEYEEALREEFIIANGLDRPSKMQNSTSESLSLAQKRVDELEQMLELKDSERLNLEEQIKTMMGENHILKHRLYDQEGKQSCMGCIFALFLFLVVPSLVHAGFQSLRNNSCNHLQSLTTSNLLFLVYH